MSNVLMICGSLRKGSFNRAGAGTCRYHALKTVRLAHPPKARD
jgi:hypothetical protein